MKFMYIFFTSFLLAPMALSMSCLEEHPTINSEIAEVKNALQRHIQQTTSSARSQDGQLQNLISPERLNFLRHLNCRELSQEETNLRGVGSVGFTVQEILSQRFYIGLRMHKCVAQNILNNLSQPIANWDIQILQRNSRSLHIFLQFTPYRLRTWDASLERVQNTMTNLHATLRSSLTNCVRPVATLHNLPQDIDEATSPPEGECQGEAGNQDMPSATPTRSLANRLRQVEQRQQRLLSQRQERQARYQQEIARANAPARLRSEALVEAEITNALVFARDHQGRLPRNFDPVLARMELEATRSTPPITQASWDESVAKWRENLARYRQIARGQGTIDERRGELIHQVWEDYLAIYQKDEASVESALAGLGGNCQSRTHMLVAIMQMFPELVPSGQQLGIQVLSNHVETVIIPRDTNNMATHNLNSNTIGENNTIPVFSPLADLNGLLRQRAIADSELLLRGNAAMLGTANDTTLATSDNELHSPNMRHNQHWPVVNPSIRSSVPVPDIPVYENPPPVQSSLDNATNNFQNTTSNSTRQGHINPENISDLQVRNLYTDEHEELLPSLREFIENNPDVSINDYITHMLENEVNSISLLALRDVDDHLLEIDYYIVTNCEVAAHNGRNCMESPGFRRYMERINHNLTELRNNENALQYALDESQRIRDNRLLLNNGQITDEAEIQRLRSETQNLLTNNHVDISPEMLMNAAFNFRHFGIPNEQNPFHQLSLFLLDENNLSYIPNENIASAAMPRGNNQNTREVNREALRQARSSMHNYEALALTDIEAYSEFLFLSLDDSSITGQQRQNIMSRFLSARFDHPPEDGDIVFGPILNICGNIRLPRYQAIRLIDTSLNTERTIHCPPGHSTGRSPSQEFQYLVNIASQDDEPI